MTTKLDHVTAVFGGQERTFRYPRVLPNPYGLGREPSVAAALQRLAAGLWSVEDILLALSPPVDAVRPWQAAPDVLRVVEANGAGTYLQLALLIYRAALFGLDPGEARFDEATPFEVAQPAGATACP